MVTDRGGGGGGCGRGCVAAAGATRAYVCPRRDQLFLMPVSMRDWLDEGHLAWFVHRCRGRAGHAARCIAVRAGRRGARRMTRR